MIFSDTYLDASARSPHLNYKETIVRLTSRWCSQWLWDWYHIVCYWSQTLYQTRVNFTFCQSLRVYSLLSSDYLQIPFHKTNTILRKCFWNLNLTWPVKLLWFAHSTWHCEKTGKTLFQFLCYFCLSSCWEFASLWTKHKHPHGNILVLMGIFSSWMWL